MEEMRLFYTPLWQDNIARGEADWPLLRSAMLARIATLVAEKKGVDRTNFGGWQSDDDLYKHPEFGWLTQRIMALANQVAPRYSAKACFDDGNVEQRQLYRARCSQ